MVNKNELMALHSDLMSKAAELMNRKSHDYATDKDPLRNFRFFGKHGVLVRIYDKLSRLLSFEEQGTLKVTDETIEDTVLDLINYAVIYYALHTESLDNVPETC